MVLEHHIQSVITIQQAGEQILMRVTFSIRDPKNKPRLKADTW